MTEDGVTVWLAALNPSVLASIRSSAFADRLGPERLLFNARAVIRKYQDSDVECTPKVRHEK